MGYDVASWLIGYALYSVNKCKKGRGENWPALAMPPKVVLTSR